MRARKYLVLGLALVLLFTAPQALAKRTVANQTKSLLWEVKSDTTSVYLLGSIHFANQQLYPLAAGIEKAFEKSSALVVEVNPLTIDNQKMQKTIQQKGIYPDGESIKENISAEVFGMLKDVLTDYQIPAQGFMRLKPGLCSMTLATVWLMKMGYSPDYGVDQYFAQKAAGQKPIIELETMEQQLSMILNMPNPELFLKYTLLDIAKGKKFMAKTVALWKKGAADALYDLMLKPYDKNRQLLPVMNMIYFNRNLRMAARIETFLETKDTFFVVVGSAHLIGPKGIVKILRNRGYRIRQY